jgi:hypothetical protein
MVGMPTQEQQAELLAKTRRAIAESHELVADSKQSAADMQVLMQESRRLMGLTSSARTQLRKTP